MRYEIIEDVNENGVAEYQVSDVHPNGERTHSTDFETLAEAEEYLNELNEINKNNNNNNRGNKIMNNLKMIIIAGIAGALLMVTGLVQAEVQTPAQIVQAEKDAGNFFKRVDGGDFSYRMRDVIVTGEKEVTYRYEYAAFQSSYFKRLLGKGDSSSIIWRSLANGVYSSAQDRENLEGGIVYKFQWTAVSDASTEVLFDRGVTLIVQIDPNFKK